MWFDILKYIPLQPMDPHIRAARKRIDEQDWGKQLEAPDSKLVDMERAAEMDVAGNCCEQARNQVLEVLAD